MLPVTVTSSERSPEVSPFTGTVTVPTQPSMPGVQQCSHSSVQLLREGLSIATRRS
jgi:hypothetical protein